MRQIFICSLPWRQAVPFIFPRGRWLLCTRIESNSDFGTFSVYGGYFLSRGILSVYATFLWCWDRRSEASTFICCSNLLMMTNASDRPNRVVSRQQHTFIEYSGAQGSYNNNKLSSYRDESTSVIWSWGQDPRSGARAQCHWFVGERSARSSSNHHSLTSKTVSFAKIWQSNKRCQKNQLVEFGGQKPMVYFCEHDWKHTRGFKSEI